MIRKVFNPWVILGVVLLAGLMVIGSLSWLVSNRSNPIPANPARAIITVIPAPSATLLATTPTGISVPTPSPQPSPSLAPGTLAIGAYVQVAGTGGDGLRLRSAPNLTAQVRYLALEAEVFQIQDGPEQADSYTWWYLVAPYDQDRNGWAVNPYLVVIQNP